jgi:hypothetical protein
MADRQKAASTQKWMRQLGTKENGLADESRFISKMPPTQFFLAPLASLGGGQSLMGWIWFVHSCPRKIAGQPAPRRWLCRREEQW